MQEDLMGVPLFPLSNFFLKDFQIDIKQYIVKVFQLFLLYPLRCKNPVLSE